MSNEMWKPDIDLGDRHISPHYGETFLRSIWFRLICRNYRPIHLIWNDMRKMPPNNKLLRSGYLLGRSCSLICWCSESSLYRSSVGRYLEVARGAIAPPSSLRIPNPLQQSFPYLLCCSVTRKHNEKFL